MTKLQRVTAYRLFDSARIVKKREHFAKPRNMPRVYDLYNKWVDDGYMGHFWIYTKSIYAVVIFIKFYRGHFDENNRWWFAFRGNYRLF